MVNGKMATECQTLCLKHFDECDYAAKTRGQHA
jgi:hypothetical protein